MRMYRLILKTTVLVHACIIFLNMAAFFIVPLETPWYIWLPICTMIGRTLSASGNCPLTLLENKLREKIGMKPIKGFVYHYFYPYFLK